MNMVLLVAMRFSTKNDKDDAIECIGAEMQSLDVSYH